MNDQSQPDDLANVSTDLSTLRDARARVRIDAAARNADTVGSMLHRYRVRAGLTEHELATWLGIDVPILADLAEEIRPEQRYALAGHAEMGLDQLAEVYGADRARLLEAFEQGDREA
jgi:hypothetical protein